MRRAGQQRVAAHADAVRRQPLQGAPDQSVPIHNIHLRLIRGRGQFCESGWIDLTGTVKARIPPPPAAAAKSYSGVVTQVKHKRFPLVVLSVKTKAGKTLTIVPRIQTKHGIIDYSDKESKQNLAAWYARRGDKISFKVIKKENSFSVATGFSREP